MKVDTHAFILYGGLCFILGILFIIFIVESNGDIISPEALNSVCKHFNKNSVYYENETGTSTHFICAVYPEQKPIQLFEVT